MGRTKRDDGTEVIKIRLDKVTKAKIDKQAKAEDRTFADQARRLIKIGLGEVKE